MGPVIKQLGIVPGWLRDLIEPSSSQAARPKPPLKGKLQLRWLMDGHGPKKHQAVSRTFFSERLVHRGPWAYQTLPWRSLDLRLRRRTLAMHGTNVPRKDEVSRVRYGSSLFVAVATWSQD